jgi:hypothetical protein
MEYNNDFRHDLQLGQMAEKWLGKVLSDSTVEVKRDFMAGRTGRVFVEFESRGKPSGIATSEAEYWAFVLDGDRVFILPTDRLKDICRANWARAKKVSGGDSNTSRGILINTGDLVK